MNKSHEMYLARIATDDLGRLMDERNSVARCIARTHIAGESYPGEREELVWRFGALDARIQQG